MRLPLVPLFVFLIINIFVDTYIYKALKRRCRSLLPRRVQLWTAIALFILIIAVICMPRRNCSNATLMAIMWMLFTYLSVYISKYIFVIIDLIAKIPVLFKKKRVKWLSVCGATLGVIVFGAMWWGALINRFRIDVKEVTVVIPDLPDAYDGYRIAQFSDMHVGTFGNDTTFVSTFVDRINSLNPDLIVFTGDIVNSKTEELPPQVGPFSRLDAPDGVYSILGNHDYGDYSEWPSAEAKKANMDRLKELQAAMGWRLLLNETAMLHHEGDSIALIGVENIGDPPFKVYGSLTRAYPQLGDSVTKILLTHNPAHWVDSIADNPAMRVPLSLSGHTHAMQIELLGWSPAEYRYPTWGGLYNDTDNKHQLYVNIGGGTVGFPARIGATPEITLITLKKH
ncbi:metallophosphoesterase [uncultured Duncaniella sp.]|uniref:metallophosphoesterase n=2 Tax=uncultured Duncaniella sp. TaxID=2768039 RepID=UPI00261ED1E0|nr:metallophosphoesterase [uncultured Duncaniella sp.]